MTDQCNMRLDEYDNKLSNCCNFEIIFYDWYRCGNCGEFIEDETMAHEKEDND